MIQEALNEYKFHLLIHSKATQEWSLSRLRAFTAWAEQEDLQLESIKPHVVDRYIGHLSTTKSKVTGKLLSSATVHGHARAIRTFLIWVHNNEDYEGVVSDRTSCNIHMPRLEKAIIPTLTDQQIKLMFEAAEMEEHRRISIQHQHHSPRYVCKSSCGYDKHWNNHCHKLFTCSDQLVINTR